MATVPCFSEGQIEALARVLGDCGTGTDIRRVLQDRGLADGSGESTKWRRLYWVFLDCPMLALNTLQTETEKSEHKGFAGLLKGCFSAVRNPLAH